MPDGGEGLHVEFQLVAVDGAGVAGEAVHLVGVEVDVFAREGGYGAVVLAVFAFEDGGEVGDGVFDIIHKDVLHRIALYVGAVAPSTRAVFAGQAVALGDEVGAPATDFNLGVMGVDMLAVVVGGIDKVVGILGHLEGLGLGTHSDGGSDREQ